LSKFWSSLNHTVMPLQNLREPLVTQINKERLNVRFCPAGPRRRAPAARRWSSCQQDSFLPLSNEAVPHCIAVVPGRSSMAVGAVRLGIGSPHDLRERRKSASMTGPIRRSSVVSRYHVETRIRRFGYGVMVRPAIAGL
jgi:hypothetical protein